MELAVKRNLGADDRIIRAVVAAVLLALAFTFLGGGWRALAAAFGVYLVVTAAAGYCAVYDLFGWSTHRVETG